MTLMMNYFDKQYGFELLMNTSKPDIYKMEFKKTINECRDYGKRNKIGCMDFVVKVIFMVKSSYLNRMHFINYF